MKQRRNQASWIATVSVALLLLGGCAAEPTDTDSNKAREAVAENPAENPADTPATEPDNTGPREQAEDCEWSSPTISVASVPSVPAGQEGAIEDVIVGSWQHTHYDSGTGYQPLEGKDIRYVFPSTERILYCQHVPDITDFAENAAPISWDGTRIVLPGSAPGYIVSEWNDSTMVWINRMDNSRYLLQRR